jgi:hypothetical protein
LRSKGSTTEGREPDEERPYRETGDVIGHSLQSSKSKEEEEKE